MTYDLRHDTTNKTVSRAIPSPSARLGNLRYLPRDLDPVSPRTPPHSRRGAVFKFPPTKTLSDIVLSYETKIGADGLVALKSAMEETGRQRQLTFDVFLACGEIPPQAEAEAPSDAALPTPAVVSPSEGDRRVEERVITTVMMVSNSNEKVLEWSEQEQNRTK